MGIAVIPAPGGGVTQKADIFTSTNTWTAPANCFAVEVFLVGGGGGGGAHRNFDGGSGGGGGGQVITSRKLPVTPGTSYTVTIGAGGAGANSDATGAVGGDTSFGSLLTVFGGGGGGTRASSGANINPTVKATSGGVSSGGSSGGGGGGAASVFYPPQFASTTPFTQPIGNEPYGSISGTLSGGFASGTNTLAGPGIDGFGGGGQPGRLGQNNNSWHRVSVHGGGIGANDNQNGGNATANTGGGGGGATRLNSGTPSGGNGGSGYAIVTYWS